MKEVVEKNEKNNLFRPPKVGEIVQGKVIGKGRSSLFLDLGAPGTGIIYGKEYLEAKSMLRDLKIGDSLFAKIVELENEDGYSELSVSQAGEELAWDVLRQKKETGEVVRVKILGANKGGLLTEVSNISAFLPVSQLSPENYPRVEGGDTLKILRELQKFVGQEFEVTVLDLSPKEAKLILSEKARGIEKIKEILKNYKVGDVVEGEITGVVDFGAFIRFGEGIEGLIHISELDWTMVEDPAQFVKTGEKVKAKIIDISDDRVSLSLKALKKDPWENLEEKYKKGSTVRGRATKLNPFGAFIQITPKIQGLCHISEFGTNTKMEEDVKVGKSYDFQVLSIDPKEHRMSLRMVK